MSGQLMAIRNKDNPDLMAANRNLHADCPDENLIAGYACGGLDDDEFDEVVAHLNTCPHCAQDVAGIIRSSGGNDTDESSSDELEEECKRQFADGFAQLFKEMARPSGGVSSSSGEHDISLFPSKSTDNGGLTCGEKVGRYVLLQSIGSGGMGIVYAAFDPELDRKVALKLLRPDRVGSGPDEPNRVRLLREAQGMARLSHPNVIAIHDVQTFDDEIAIAMEFVDGMTLRQWQDDTQPTWRQCLDVYSLAGEGIAAAHKAGLVHRDFKPDNVLLGKDGRVRVTDFGLVRQATELQLQSHTGLTEKGRRMAPPRVSLDTSLTQTGTVLGTPAYMAPEQLLGKEVDARSDQYSFCVALYEALYGERPYTAKSFEELRDKVASGDVASPSTRRHVPSWLRDVVLQGMSRERADRYSHMEALLGALRDDPIKKSRRRLTVAGAVLAAGALVFAAIRGVTVGGLSCDAPTDEFAGAWDQRIKAKVEAAFLASGVGFAEDTYARFEKNLDSYIDEWRYAFAESCKDTHERQLYSQEVLGLRVSCLRERKYSVRALAAHMSGNVDREVLGRAVSAALRLPSVRSCGDVRGLVRQSNEISASTEPDMAPRVLALQRELREIEVLDSVGSFLTGLERAEAALQEAKRAGIHRLLAQVLYWNGILLERTGAYRESEQRYSEAMGVAGFVGARELHIRSLLQLAFVVSMRLADTRRALALFDHLNESMVPAEGGRLLLAEFLRRRGLVRGATGHLQQGTLDAQRAVDLELAEHGERDHPRLILALTTLGSNLSNLGRNQEALAVFERTATMAARLYGPNNIFQTASLANLGGQLLWMGEYERAKAPLSRAYRISVEALGSESYSHRNPLAGLAEIALFHDRDLARAESFFSDVVRIGRETSGVDQEDVRAALGLGEIALERGRLEEAQKQFTEALETLRTMGAELADANARWIAQGHFGLARTLWSRNGSRQSAAAEASLACVALTAAKLPLDIRLQTRIASWLQKRGAANHCAPAERGEPQFRDTGKIARSSLSSRSPAETTKGDGEQR